MIPLGIMLPFHHNSSIKSLSNDEETAYVLAQIVLHFILTCRWVGSANMSSSENPNGNSRTRLVNFALIAFVLIGLGIAAYLVSLKKHGGNGSDVSKSQKNCEKSVVALNEAISYLESAPDDRLDDAEKLLTELAKQYPNEPAAVRNLAICRVGQVNPERQVKSDTPRPDPAYAFPAIEAARKLEPKSAVPHILAARVHQWKQDSASAYTSYLEAAKLAPNDPSIWQEVDQMAIGTDNEEVRKKAADALVRALQIDPSNSHLLKQRMEQQAREKDKEIVETVKALRSSIEPVLPAVKKTGDFDLLAQQLTTAVEAEKWPAATLAATKIKNIITPTEWVRSHLRKLNKHVLSFMVLEFSPAVCGDAVESTGPLEPRIDVKFQADSSKELSDYSGVQGISAADVDKDGLFDIVALTDAELFVVTRAKIGEPWKKAGSIAVRGPMHGILAADLDRDIIAKAKPVADPGQAAAAKSSDEIIRQSCHEADVDFIVFGANGVQIFLNDTDEQGKLVLRPVDQSPEFDALRNVLAAVLADVDHDGDLDLILSTPSGISIWLNNGNAQYTDASSRSALTPADLAVTTLVAVDWDRDLDIDILISGPDGKSIGWLENLRHGALRWSEFDADFKPLAGAATLNILENDGHPSWDLIGFGASGGELARTTTEPGGVVKALDVQQIADFAAQNFLVADLDNDTYPDIVAWKADGIEIWWGSPGSKFEKAASLFDHPPSQTANCVSVDFDNDGDLDLLLVDGQKIRLFDNVGGNKNHWLSVRAKGEAGDNKNTGDVNHFGIGSLLELKAGRRYQAQVITGQVTHFGLGKQAAADILRAVWTTGVSQSTPHPKADLDLCRIHVIGTSCPYFYTWNGNEFVFCTDACWAAPLGLQLAEGVIAEPRAWEYLSIPPGRLAPKEGKYVIQMTEELWEATYLDQMELLVVDHPADVDVFSNEKVGPPELAEHKIHTVRERRLPVSARDKHGRDVLQQVSREDGDFMKGFDADPQHGVTDQHYLELDLGPLENPKQVTLFLTGWMYPASTSMRVGLSQDPSRAQLMPPALEVPDANGEWKVVQPFMGFPGGRTKTIAVDLSKAFLTNDYRLRIVTNLEFFWDAAFFTVDEDPASLEVKRLAPSSADLHYRGFSRIIQRSLYAPYAYNYNDFTREPKWAPMAGLFTRFGDVTELVQQQDDLQVVFGSGDELTVAFDVPEKEPPAGWKRDFILHNVGWDKDNDLNVVSSQEVEPLPFNAMSGYPYRADEQYPDTERHRAYLRKYQTRRQQPVSFWRQVQPTVENQ